jgi:hypothetical protein
MGTSTARIYRTIYIVIYGPVRVTANLGFRRDYCFLFYDLFCIRTPKLAIPSSSRMLALALYFSPSDILLLVATYAVLCFFFFFFCPLARNF